MEHWLRLFELAHDYETHKHQLKNPNDRLQQIIAGINYWDESKPISTNSWWNTTGIPLNMGKV